MKAAGSILVFSMSLLTELNVNLKTGKVSSGPLGEGMAWTVPPYTLADSAPGSCTTRGVLKLTFDQVRRVRAEIELDLKDPTGFSFDVGDSATNNGWAGDSGSQSNDAEVHGKDNSLLFYGKDVAYGESAGLLYDGSGKLTSGTLTLTVQDGLAAARLGQFYTEVRTWKMFALNNQTDWEGPVNNDVYFAFNRVPDGDYRSGTGVCGFRVKFYSTRV